MKLYPKCLGEITPLFPFEWQNFSMTVRGHGNLPTLTGIEMVPSQEKYTQQEKIRRYITNKIINQDENFSMYHS